MSVDLNQRAKAVLGDLALQLQCCPRGRLAERFPCDASPRDASNAPRLQYTMILLCS